MQEPPKTRLEILQEFSENKSLHEETGNDLLDQIMRDTKKHNIDFPATAYANFMMCGLHQRGALMLSLMAAAAIMRLIKIEQAIETAGKE